MSVIVFNQWDKLVAMFRRLANACATERSQYDLNRVMDDGELVTVKDRAMNTLELTERRVTVVMPDMIPGKAREFLLRVKAHGECSLVFGGTAVFEGEYGSLDSPLDGETVIYFFTETDADVFLVSRRIVSQIESE